MAAAVLNRLELRLLDDSDPYGPVFDILIDGENLLDRIRQHESRFTDSIAGAYAPYLGPDQALRLLDPPAFIMPYACDCGEPECWFLTCGVTAHGDTVRWADWQNPYRNDPARAADGLDWRYGEMPTFEFARAPYGAAIEAALATLGTSREK
jgi:hypothetical protein